MTVSFPSGTKKNDEAIPNDEPQTVPSVSRDMVPKDEFGSLKDHMYKLRDRRPRLTQKEIDLIYAALHVQDDPMFHSIRYRFYVLSSGNSESWVKRVQNKQVVCENNVETNG